MKLSEIFLDFNSFYKKHNSKMLYKTGELNTIINECGKTKDIEKLIAYLLLHSTLSDLINTKILTYKKKDAEKILYVLSVNNINYERDFHTLVANLNTLDNRKLFNKWFREIKTKIKTNDGLDKYSKYLTIEGKYNADFHAIIAGKLVEKITDLDKLITGDEFYISSIIETYLPSICSSMKITNYNDKIDIVLLLEILEELIKPNIPVEQQVIIDNPNQVNKYLQVQQIIDQKYQQIQTRSTTFADKVAYDVYQAMKVDGYDSLKIDDCETSMSRNQFLDIFKPYLNDHMQVSPQNQQYDTLVFDDVIEKIVTLFYL